MTVKTLISAAELIRQLSGPSATVLLDCRFDLADTQAGARAWREGHPPGAFYLHRDDEFLYKGVVQQGLAFGFKVEPQPPIDTYYGADGPIRFGKYEVHVHHTPGHCPGGVCLAVRREGSADHILFVGDTLFAGSIGRTDLPGGNYETLMHSITGVLFRFPDDAVVHSGHGPDTTIGRERETNPFVQEWLMGRG